MEQEETEEHVFTVTNPEMDGERLDKFIASQLLQSRSQVNRNILEVQINSKMIYKAHYKVRLNDEVKVLVRKTKNNNVNLETEDEIENEINGEVKEKEETQTKVFLVPEIEVDSDFILIDGSFSEGGGQILRQSFSLAGILKKKIKIINIRANRENPGLQQQHLTGIQLVSSIYSSLNTNNLIGAMLCSKEVMWCPGEFSQKTFFSADIKTAGSVALLMQTALPCLLFGKTKVEIELHGGTHVPKSPQTDYIEQVLAPLLNMFGATVELQVKKRGYFPKGGGSVTLSVHPVKFLKPINIISQGDVDEIHIKSFISGKVHIETGRRSATFAYNYLVKRLGTEKVKYTTEVAKEAGMGNGTSIIALAKTNKGNIIAGSALGNKGVTAEKVGKIAASQLLFNILKGGSVDEFLQDQLIIYCALARGRSSFRCGPITAHTKTAIHFASMLTGAQFSVRVTEERPREHEKSYIITCEGIGKENEFLHTYKNGLS